MPAKKKNNKGQEMSLGEFLGPNVATGGEHDWAEEVWDPSTEGDHGQNASAAGGAAGVDRRFHDNRYNHDRSALGTKTNFRDATSKVPDDMPPPYVAHLGNLKTGITKEELCAEFFPDKIVECRLITRDERSTFAFLEFQDVRTLQLVLLMVDRVVLGRKVRIDVASPEQIARMTNHGKNNEGGFGKRFGGSEAGGGHSSAGLDQLDREVFGTGSPVTQGNNRNFRGNNNNNNNNNGPMSGDAFSDFRSGPTMMQHGGGGSMMDLDNWRDGGDAPQAQQPAFPGDRRRGGSRSPTASGAPSFGGGGRRAQPQQNDDNGTTAQSPTTEGNNEEVGGSWRDAPRQAQPELMSRREQPTTDNNSNAAPGRGPRNPNNNNNKETSASSSSTQQQAPAAAAAAGDRGSFFGCSVQPNNNNNNNAPTTTNTNAAAGEKRGNNKKSQGPQSPTTAVVSAPTTTTTTTTTESPAAPTAVAAATPAKPSSWAAAVTAKPAAVAPPVAPSSSSAPAKQIAARPASGTNNNQKPAAAKASSDDRFKR